MNSVITAVGFLVATIAAMLAAVAILALITVAFKSVSRDIWQI